MSSQDIFVLFGGLTLILGLLFWIRGKSVIPPVVLNLRDSSNAETVRILNVIFVWNGHPWDAFEVLGVPAGSSLEAVEKAYQDLLSKTDPQSAPFIEAAYQAIHQKIKSSSSSGGSPGGSTGGASGGASDRKSVV